MFFELKERLLHPSLRLRLTAMFSVILALALGIFSLLLYNSFIESHQEDFDIALFNHSVDVAEEVDMALVSSRLSDPNWNIDASHFQNAPVQRPSVFGDVKLFPFSLSRSFMQIRSSDGRILAASGPLKPFSLPFDVYDSGLLNHGRDSTFHTLRIEDFVTGEISGLRDGSGPEDELFRLINLPLDDSPVPQLILQIAVPLTLFELQHLALRQFFYLSIPVALLLAAIGGYFLAGRALKPVAQMTRTASVLGVGDLSARLPVPRVRDEMQRLALTMNNLLSRVEQAFRSQERFIADASHQLLTPLAILRGELDVTSKKDPEEIRKFLESASQEIDQLSRTVRDMLLLARADAGVASLTLAPVRIDEVILEASERVRRYAQARGVRLRVNVFDTKTEDSFEVMADKDLVQALFQNLIENAIKYSPEREVVDVTVESMSEKLKVIVSDRGPGIPADEIPHLFERFYRSPRTSQRAEGVGLGLAIAKRISDVHGAKLSVDSVVGSGTKFTVDIPKAR